MTAFYGSKAVPKKIFGEGAMHETFIKVMGEAAPGPWQLNQTFLDIWDAAALSHEWILPDNYHVKVKVMGSFEEMVQFQGEPFEVVQKLNTSIPEGRSLAANTVHSIDGLVVREMARRCNYDPVKIDALRKVLAAHTGACELPETPDADWIMVDTLWDHFQKSGYLSTRILEHLNAENLGLVEESIIEELLSTLPEKPFEILTIHDCFRCLPNYANDLRWQYNLQLYMLAQSDMLGFILSQITKKPYVVIKRDDNLADDIMESNYSLS